MTQAKQPSKYTKSINKPIVHTVDKPLSYNLKRIQQAAFLMSAPTFKLCTEDTGCEVAFAGRSNAGKSSAINTLTNQKQLARSSKTPGRTQMINFFTVGEEDTRLVDLPGYGYAAVPKEMKIKWQIELEEYLVERDSLKGLVLLTDIRHPLKYFDEQMLHWAKDGGLAVHILLTKSDKLKYGAAKSALLKTRKALKKMGLPCTIQLFSALKKEGIDELADVLGGWLNLDENSTEAITEADVEANIASDENNNIATASDNTINEISNAMNSASSLTTEADNSTAEDAIDKKDDSI